MRRGAWLGGLLAVLLFYDAALVTNGTFDFFAPESMGLTYNSMFVNLLQGDASVDPAAIAWEGFRRDGRTHTHFGVLPAALRAPFAPFVAIAETHVSHASCLLANLALLACLFASAWVVQARFEQTPARVALLSLFLLNLALTGPTLYMLGAAPVYHEAILWAAACTALFNFVALRRAFSGEPFRGSDLLWMAVAAGGGLLSRVSAGSVLYAATLVVAVHAAWKRRPLPMADGRQPTPGRGLALGLMRLGRERGALLAVFVLLACGVAQLGLNVARWGEPFSYARMELHVQYAQDAERLARIERSGVLNPARIPAALAYYAAGSSTLAADLLRVASTENDGIEGPTASALLQSPLLLVLAGLGVWTLASRRRPIPMRLTLAWLLLVQLAGVALMLSFMYLALRYRTDALGLLSLAAMLGFHTASRNIERGSPLVRIGLLGAALTLLLIGVWFSHLTLLDSKLSYFSTDEAAKAAILQWLQ